MDTVPTFDARAALISRIKGLLFQPKEEWPKIHSEPATVGSLYAGYVVYVAAIPIICTLLGSLVFGLGINGIIYRPSVSEALTSAVLQYALQLGGVYVFALIIDALTPSFGGRKDRVSAFKLAAYSATASWLAGIFMLVPSLSVLTLLGLYSLYLLYTGIPVLMKVPTERTFTFTAAIIAVGIVISIVALFLGAALLPNQVTAPVAQQGGKLTLPGGGSLDMSQLEQAQKRLEYITKNLEQTQRGADGGKTEGSDADSNATESGDAEGLPPIAPDELKALLPNSLPGGFIQSEISTSSAGAGGFTFGEAKAVYANGDQRITLSLMDMGALGALASLGSAFGANASEETETSYSKMGHVDGRMTMEDFNRETRTGKFGMIVSGRVMVEAQGTGASMADLKSAVQAIEIGRIEALAK